MTEQSTPQTQTETVLEADVTDSGSQVCLTFSLTRHYSNCGKNLLSI